MMRRTLVGLLTVGVLVVGACSDDGDGGDDAGSGGEATGSAETFCEQFRSYDEQFANDPAAAEDQERVLDAMRSLEPPEEIAEDFRTSLEANEAAAAGEQVDTDAVVAANERIQAFIEDECGFNPRANDSTTSPSAETPSGETPSSTGAPSGAEGTESTTVTSAGG